MPETFYLFDHAQGKELKTLKFQAALHGVDLDEESKGNKVKQTDGSLPMFGDPKDYDSMTPEQREQVTQNMMKKLKRFAQDPVKFTAAGGVLNG